MNRQTLAQHVIAALSKGIPPQRGFDLYSVGHNKLIKGVKKHHMGQIRHQGLILFINGSYGAGKTHLFRLLRETALKQDCLVSNVELHAKETPFSKFEMVFSGIMRNIQTPAMYEDAVAPEAQPFARVLDEALSLAVSGTKEPLNEITGEQYNQAFQTIMGNRRIDLDFKKVVARYWESYVPNRVHPTEVEILRGEALQWFSGEGTQQTFKTKFDVNKMVTGETARQMLQSLAGFVDLAGYQGMTILFDEATQAYEHMPKNEMRHAYNNLFHLMNEIEQSPGLFFVYATTPGFYTNPKYGILNHDALASRIGRLRDKAPRTRDTVWNLDEVKIGLADYIQTAMKIRDVYREANEDDEENLDAKLPSQGDIEGFVEKLFKQHGTTSNVRFWRVMTAALIPYFEDCIEGEETSAEAYAEEAYEDVMDVLSEEE
jgi:hypothetical protein